LKAAKREKNLFTNLNKFNRILSASSAPSVSSQTSTPAAASPGKHMSESDLYTSSGLSSVHHNHQSVSTSSITSNALSSVLSLSSTSK